jgi:hypothetical protein
MLTENTGAHFLDSGGAYGRHWERNAGMNVAEWDATPSATLDNWQCASVSTYHYMSDRLKFAPELDESFQQFADTMPDSGWLDIIEEWLDTLPLVTSRDIMPDGRHGWNTYNGEDNLTQVLQGTTFRLDDGYGGQVFAIVQTHNGCDVRGGYSTPRVFEVSCDMAEYFPYDNADMALACSASCGWYADIRGGEYYDVDSCYGRPSELFEQLYVPTDDEPRPEATCPKCRALVSAYAPSA